MADGTSPDSMELRCAICHQRLPKMRIITFQAHGRTRWGALQNGHAIDLNAAHAKRGVDMFLAPTVLDFLRGGETIWNTARETLAWMDGKELPEVTFEIDDIQLLAPI